MIGENFWKYAQRAEMEHAYINNDVVRWARERSGLGKEVLAERLGVSLQQVNQWELGSQHPPFGKAQSLADVLDIPFGFLFLSAPPAEKPAIPDLRRIGPDKVPPSPEFVDLLNDVVIKHDWYSEYAKESGSKPLPFVGSRTIRTPRATTVSEIRSVMEPEELRRKAKSTSDYLRLLVLRAEESGVLVMRAGVVRGNPRRKLAVSEFRGFAMSDSFAPLVFINSRDAQAAQVFTLAHELTHVWLGTSGISNPDLSQRTEPTAPEDVVEQYCNDVATELLVPGVQFDTAWKTTSGDNNHKTDRLTTMFRVSNPVILRRALERNHLSQAEFFRLWNSYRQRAKELEKMREEEPGDGNFYNTFFARNSFKLSQAIVSFARAGRMGTLEAARLLNVHTSTLPKLAERLMV
jgi:Zn-dependent peptidase ImmA (M78 family)/DNA-binding XRE family transcriptional regulator